MYSKVGIKITNAQFDLRISGSNFYRIDDYINSKTSIRFGCKKCDKSFHRKPKAFNKLSFDFLKETGINYWWAIDGIRKHKLNFKKKILVSKGYDKDLSESEIMSGIGYYKLYGCGLSKWQFKKDN